MAENSAIEWTDHTFNPWRGCQKVSPGCENCYAETLSHRNPGVLGEWGPPHATERPIAAESYWRKPLAWNRQAEAAGRPARVFVASLADVFEDAPQVVDARARLFDLMADTPWLTWLVLTKRPENVRGLTPWTRWGDSWPVNVWLGTSVEDQQRADERIPALLDTPAAVRFLSCEPLLGPVTLERWLGYNDPADDGAYVPRAAADQRIRWVIVGGESGPRARPMHPAWARTLRDQCTDAGVPFLFKQWGAWSPSWTVDGGTFELADLRDDETVWPNSSRGRWEVVRRVGKKAAGRVLDGRTWDEFPEEVPAHA